MSKNIRLAAGMSSKVAALCLCSLLLTCAPSLVRAQAEKDPQRGFTPGNSFALGEVESINTTNGNLMFNFPLGRLAAGRGGLSATVNLIYNSKLYDTQIEEFPDESNQIIKQNFLSDSPEGGWRLSYWYDFELVYRHAGLMSAPGCNTAEGIYVWKLKMSFPDGSKREFRPINFPNDEGWYDVNPGGVYSGCRGGGTTNTMFYYSTDGTYMRLEFPHVSGLSDWRQNWTLSMPDGTRVVSTDTSRRIYDRNNNFIELQSTPNYDNTGLPASLLADEFGRTVALQSISQTETQVHTRGFNNQRLTWRVLWKTISVEKSYRTTAVTDGRERGGSSIQTLQMPFKVVDRIIMPTQAGGQSYVFGYNDAPQGGNPQSYGWGEVSSVTLPTGAQVAYQFEHDGYVLQRPNVRDVLDNSPSLKTLSYQAEYDGASTPVTEEWHYSIGDTGSNVTAPDGGNTFQSYGSTAYENKLSGLVLSVDNPDGSRVERDWQQNYPIGFSTAYGANPYVRTEFVSIRDAGGNFTKTAIKDFNYDKNGNLTRVKEYDWVSYGSVHGTGGVPLWNAARPAVKRETVNTYNSPTPDATNSTTSSGNAYFNGSAPLLRNAIASSEVREGALTRSRAEFVYDSPTTTGNVVEKRSWDDTRGPLLSPLPDGSRLDATNAVFINSEYDPHGNVLTVTEPGRADGTRSLTRYVYGLVNGQADLYPTETIVAFGTPRARTTAAEYDFWTGLVTRVTDVDNNVSTSTVYDPLGRPTLVKAAEGKPEETRTVTVYADVERRVVVRSDFETVGDGRLVSVRHFDQMGRVRLGRSLENSLAEDELDEADGIKVQTRYKFSNPNSHALVSNPYRAATSGAAGGEATMGWTLSTSDRAGRVVRIEAFAGAALPAPFAPAAPNTDSTGAVVSSYDAEAVTVTDQAGKSRRSITDSLGRLTQVFEAPGVTDYDHQTTYSYNVLDNLTQVTQDVQARTFTYSSLARLLTAMNPESGTIAYEYDANGNVKKRTDARGVVTDYLYDELNRVKARNYSDSTPDVTYVYDASGDFSKGQLSSVTSSVSTYNYASYDALGRVKSSTQTVPGLPAYTMPEYTYNRAGALVSEQYPSGKVVQTKYDAAGRVGGVRKQGGDFYAGGDPDVPANPNVVRYAAHGGVESHRLGNGLWENTAFNSRLQPSRIAVGTSSNGSATMQLDYGYGPAGMNNGDVRSQRILIAGALDLTQTYEYDALDRLWTAEEKNGAATVWKQVYKYDRFGNRTLDAGTAHPPTLDGTNNPSISPLDNRISAAGYDYDVAGNLKCDPLRPCGAGGSAYYTYDGENRMVATGGGASYQYDGDGRRVKKVTPSSTTVYVYDAMGQLVAEYSNQSEMNGVSYLTQDHLGSTRLVTGADGQPRSRHDYLPFGEEAPAAANVRTEGQKYVVDNVKQKFTGKERDEETGLDYSIARYYSSTHGRFTSADPLMASAHPGNPQSWNRYSYAQNNPLKLTDPNGMESVYSFKDYKDLTEEERRILNNSTVTFKEGKKTFTFTKGQGEGLYNYMKGNQKQQDNLAGFLNMTAGLADIKFANGRSAISYVQGITGVTKGERIYANIDTDLQSQLETISSAKATSEKRFIGPGKQKMEHKGPDGTKYDVSFRENIIDGQMQLSFASTNKGKLDMDADEKGDDCTGCSSWDHKWAARDGADPKNIYKAFTSRPTGQQIRPSYTIEEKKKR